MYMCCCIFILLYIIFHLFRYNFCILSIYICFNVFKLWTTYGFIKEYYYNYIGRMVNNDFYVWPIIYIVRYIMYMGIPKKQFSYNNIIFGQHIENDLFFFVYMLNC